jgi:hypothetical protein
MYELKYIFLKLFEASVGFHVNESSDFQHDIMSCLSIIKP